jgi:uncharacterized protein
MAAEIAVSHQPERHRYEITVDGALAGHADYLPRDGFLIFTHTEVDKAYGGRGLAGRLAAFALDDVRARGLRLAAQCPYIAKYVDAHPAYADLLVS